MKWYQDKLKPEYEQKKNDDAKQIAEAIYELSANIVEVNETLTKILEQLESKN